MLKLIKIRNFKNIKSEDVDFDKLTVFVGANASGKTSILEAVHFATLASNGDPTKVFGYERHCDWLFTRGGTGDLSLECETESGTYGISATPQSLLGFSADDRERLGSGLWTFTKTPGDESIRRAALRTVKSMVFLHLNAANLARESYSESQPPRVEFDGTGLASVLAYLKLSDDEAFERIEHTMGKFVPHFRRIRVQKKTIRRIETEYIKIDNESVPRRTRRSYQGEALLFDFANSKNVSAHTVSEGTLLLLGLLTVMLGPIRPNILLMDDIEHGLHPLAQKHLLKVLTLLMGEFPDLQVIASAHSPYLLDGLKPEQVRLVSADDEGYSIVRKLADHPDFEKWKDEMAPGEMWSMFGEQWAVEPKGER